LWTEFPLIWISTEWKKLLKELQGDWLHETVSEWRYSVRYFVSPSRNWIFWVIVPPFKTLNHPRHDKPTFIIFKPTLPLFNSILISNEKKKKLCHGRQCWLHLRHVVTANRPEMLLVTFDACIQSLTSDVFVCNYFAFLFSDFGSSGLGNCLKYHTSRKQEF
jgi:hypothetical protein